MGTEGEITTLGAFIKALEIGDPVGHLTLTLVPLRGDAAARIEYVLAADAIRAGTLTVTEVSEAGSVPELAVTSTDDRMILLLDGEELVGAKQNRILNTSILLPPRAKTRIPVSCVEQGRWRHASQAFSPGNYSPSSLRARKSHDVYRNLRAGDGPRSDQAAVWESVASNLQSAATESPTGSLHDAYERRQETLSGYVDALPYPAGGHGVIVAIDGQFAALDAFSRATTLERIWGRLVTGYAMDALGREEGRKKTFTAKGATAVFDHLAGIPCQPCPSVGIGEDWRFESDALVGQALVAEGECVHLCAFPAVSPGVAGERGLFIQPPSRRRSHRGRGDELVR